MIKHLKLKALITALYIIGLFCFIGSFLFPSTPQKMTNHLGEKVDVWKSPLYTHFSLAFEPLIQMFEYLLDEIDPNDKGDGFKYAQIERIKRLFYSIPTSIGWFSIILSVIFIPLVELKIFISKQFQQRLKIVGGIMLCAVPLLSIDFYKSATVYKGYFHLGIGALLIVLSYIFIGIYLLFKPIITRNTESRSSG